MVSETYYKTYKLGEIGEIVTGKTPSTKIKENFGDFIPFVTPGDLQNGKFVHNTDRYLSKKGLDEIKNKLLPAGSIMVSCIGTVGEIAIAREDCVTNQQINSIIPYDDFSGDYIYYNLKQRKIELQIFASGGSVVPIINKTDFSELSINLPNRTEQDRIANILSSFDNKIELNQRMNATLEGIARAVFKSWFVDFDPVRAKMAGEPYPLPDEIMALFPHRLVESALGLIPEGWEVGIINDISEVMIGGDWGEEEKNNSYNFKVRCLRGADLEKLRQFGFSNEIPVRWIKESSYKKRSLDEYDIIIASSGVGPLGRPLWINPWINDNYNEPIVYSNFTKRLRANTKELAIYLDYATLFL